MTVCEQQKPGDAGCLAKARAKCAKIAAKISDAPKGAGDKARAAITKACAAADPEAPRARELLGIGGVAP